MQEKSNPRPKHQITVNQARRIGENKELRKIIFKSKGATMTLFKDIPYYNATIRVEALKRLYSDWRGEFVIIR